MNIALLDNVKDVFSVRGREILACVSGQEGYELWKTCFGQVIGEINRLTASEKITMIIDGQPKAISLDFYLGGDYKWLLAVLGMNAAMASYACIYCFVHAVSI